MADGGQRLLDVIDDPNALESFLGGLTGDSELLPSAESVDNVVASLARSLEGEYEVDSPNDTLFDTLEPSSNNLTDISQSYVNSDFDNVNMSNVGQGNYSSGMESITNGEINHVHHHNIQNSMSSVVTTGAEQYLVSTHQSTSNSSNNSTSNVTTSIQQFTSNNSNCDSSSIVSTTSATGNSQFFQQQQQQQQIQIGQNQVLLQNSNNNASYVFSHSNQTQQIVGLSSATGDGQISNSSLNNMISVAVSNSNSDGGQGMTNTFIQQQGNIISHQGQQMQVIGQQTSAPNSNLNVVNVTASTSNSVSSTTVNNELTCNNNSNTAGNNIGSNTSSNNMQQQYVASATHQQTTINQLVSGQTVSLANMNVGGAQLISTSTGSIVTTGQGQANILQQIQSANGGQSYITVEQPGTALLAAPGGFGGANLALVTTGGAPTYTVVPTGTQFLSNAIMAQPQAIQTLTKGPNGTYYQTTGGTQIVTSNVNPMHNITVSVANTNTNKPKQPPQLLPKPQANGASVNSSGSSVQVNHSSSSETVSSSSVTSTNTTQASGTVCTPTESVMTQIYQQQQTAQIQGIQNQVVVTSVGNNAMTIPQQQFTLGNAAGIGQVMVSQNHTQQTQLTGTIVVNQYGQPMLLPTASAGQGGGLQFILRQQPTQPQVLTIQAPAGTVGNQSSQGTGGKSIVRYVSQMPQVAQTSGYGLQQIQTANGPAWVAVRYPQPTTTTIATSAGQFSQIQAETLIHNSPAVQAQMSNQTQQVQVQTLQPQQQTIPQSPQPHTSQPPTPQPLTPRPQTPQPQPVTVPVKKQQQTATPDSSSGPPPAKKPKTKKSNKKKVTLDLEQLLKQSGIMDEDLEDDGSFNFSFSTPETQNGFNSNTAPSTPQQNVIPPSPVQVQQSPVQHPAVNTSGNNKNASVTPKRPPAKSRKKKAPEKRKTPSPPPPPPPKSKGSRKRGGNQKADTKTEAYKPPAAPKKLSSIDSVSATIAAVAAYASSPSPPPSPKPSPILPTTPKPISQAVTPNVKPMTPAQVPVPYSIANNSGGTPNGINSLSSQPGTRIVQTIQLTPQNQLLLRNIQTQIARLVSLPKRNDNEQSALQKLIVLQQQVIATGIPVPNPSHLNNLAQNVNANITSAVLPASTFSTSAVPITSSGTTSAERDSLISSNSSSNSSASKSIANVSSLPQSINISNIASTNQSNNNNIQKLINPKVSSITNSTSAVKSNNVSGSVNPVVTTTNDSTNSCVGATGNVIQSQSGVAKVVVANINPEANANAGSTEDNKENTSGGPSLVVASSNFTTATNTTSSLGQHHLQSFPATFRSTVDDKKADEQRLANQKADEEKRARWKKEEFEMLLKRDQQCVVKPDYEIPFSSKRDAVERLMKYHILRDRNDMHFDEFDAEFGEKGSLLLDKFQGMISKHRSLLMKESMREVGCAERVMLERMFVSEEKLKLEQDRLLVSQGDFLELPPAPSMWVPKIKEMVDKEMKELERDSYVNQQVQSAIDSIIGFGSTDAANFLPDEGDKVEYDAFGVPINNGAYGGMNNSSSADIDEAVRSILS